MARVYIIVLGLLLFVGAGKAIAQQADYKAGQAILMDAASGAILFEKDADKAVPPASLAKLMTMEVVFDGLVSGKHNLSQAYKVSEDAWRRGGAPSGTSAMFAALKSEVTLQNLIRGATVQVANDACIIMAEGIAGSEAGFVLQMNQRSKQIGLVASKFVNSTGLPQDGQHVTMRDMAKLARHLIRTYPEQYKFYGEREFTFEKWTFRNRNPLMANTPGVDGLALGFTEGVGFSFVVSAERNGMRLIAALSGIPDEKTRIEEAKKILEWGFSGFEQAPLFKEGEIVGEAQVFGGETLRVPLVAHGPVAILLEKQSETRVRAEVTYTGPLIAPVVKDQPVGIMQFTLGGKVIQETPVYAATDVQRGTLWQRALSAVGELATGWFRRI